MQFQVLESDDSCQPGPQYTNPRVVVQEHHGAPLLNCSGLVLVRQLIERLGPNDGRQHGTAASGQRSSRSVIPPSPSVVVRKTHWCAPSLRSEHSR